MSPRTTESPDDADATTGEGRCPPDVPDGVALEAAADGLPRFDAGERPGATADVPYDEAAAIGAELSALFAELGDADLLDEHNLSDGW